MPRPALRHIIDFYHNGKRYRRKFNTIEAAEKWRTDIEAGRPVAKMKSLIELVAAFIHWSDRVKAPATVRGIRQVLHVFLGWADKQRIRSVRELTKPRMFDWQAYYFDNAPFYAGVNNQRRKKTNPVASWEKYRQYVGAFCNWCVKQECLDRNPIAGRDFRVSYQKGKIRAFGDDELTLVINYVDERDQRRGSTIGSVFRVLLYTGMRIGELVHLTWDNVSLDPGNPLITVTGTEAHNTKNRQTRVIPVHNKLLPVLGAIAPDTLYVFDRGDNRPMYSRDYYSKVMREAVQRHGIKGCNVHSLRHTFCV